MNKTLKAIFIALQTAPLIAVAIALPFVVIHYTRSKSLNVRRCTYLYVFVLYFICAYFMTLLPFPNKEDFAHMGPIYRYIRLIPFQYLFNIKTPSFALDVAFQILNVIMTIPLGFFLRYLYGISLKKVVLAGFLTSLLYEITQVTGIFFIYPRPYRFFDVDDLITNTLGALIGYQCMPAISRIIPSMFVDKQKLMAGSEVAFLQRCVATLIDFGLVLLISITGIVSVPSLRALFSQSGPLAKFPLFYALFLLVAASYAMLFGGGTLGTRLTQLRLLVRGGKKVTRIRCSMRFIIICTSVIANPFWVYFFMTVNKQYAGMKSILWVFFGTVFMIFSAAVVLEMMFNAITNGSSMFYDRFLKTYVVYDKNRNFSLFGIRVIDIQPLTFTNVDSFSEQICDALLEMGVSESSILKVRLMAEGIMLDWIANGLENVPCELRVDKRYKQNMLMLSVSGEDKTNASLTDSYTDMLKELNLKLITYYAAEKNICNILVP